MRSPSLSKSTYSIFVREGIAMIINEVVTDPRVGYRQAKVREFTFQVSEWLRWLKVAAVAA
jgi:hypothetical protein